jgi:hypothetical protein
VCQVFDVTNSDSGCVENSLRGHCTGAVTIQQTNLIKK